MHLRKIFIRVLKSQKEIFYKLVMEDELNNNKYMNLKLTKYFIHLLSQFYFLQLETFINEMIGKNICIFLLFFKSKQEGYGSDKLRNPTIVFKNLANVKSILKMFKMLTFLLRSL